MTDLRVLQAFIQTDSRLVRLSSLVEAEASHDAAHDVWHFRRVAASARDLAPAELDPVLVIAAGLVHDIVHIPKDSPLRSKGSELSATRAASLLRDAGFAPSDIDAITEAVRDHSWSSGKTPSTILGCVLKDADRLEALGAIGLLRCVATGVGMGADMFHPEDPFAEHRDLDDRAHSVDHLFVKLLKLPSTFSTEAGRQEAERRAEWLRGFLRQLAQEVGRTPPAPAFTPPSDTP